MSKRLLENLNALVALVGFVALEAGLVLRLGWSAALVAGGAVLIVLATAPYAWHRTRKPN